MRLRSSISRLCFVAGAGAATVPFLRSTGSAAQFEYKMALGVPAADPIFAVLTQLWETVKTESGGRLVVTIFPGSQLAAQDQIITQVRLGAVQICTYANSTFSGVVPSVMIDSVGFAFTTSQQAWRAMDGALGAYVREQFAAKGLIAMPKKFESGMRQVSTSTKPIRTAADFVGLKMCVAAANLSVELFKTLGASPAPIPSNEWYTSLQTHLVDGVDCPLRTTDSFKLFEVQKYLSITNHSWDGQWMIANAAAWNALPADIQAIVTRNEAKCVDQQRTMMVQRNASLAESLRQRGMTVNTADSATMRAKLGDYYEHVKAEFGNILWALLEGATGKLAST